MNGKNPTFKYKVSSLDKIIYKSVNGVRSIEFSFKHKPDSFSICIGNEHELFTYKKVSSLFKASNIKRTLPFKIKSITTIKPFLNKLSKNEAMNRTKIIRLL